MPKAHDGTLNDQLLAVNEGWWSVGNHAIHGINKPADRTRKGPSLLTEAVRGCNSTDVTALQSLAELLVGAILSSA